MQQEQCLHAEDVTLQEADFALLLDSTQHLSDATLHGKLTVRLTGCAGAWQSFIIVQSSSLQLDINLNQSVCKRQHNPAQPASATAAWVPSEDWNRQRLSHLATLTAAAVEQLQCLRAYGLVVDLQDRLSSCDPADTACLMSSVVALSDALQQLTSEHTAALMQCPAKPTYAVTIMSSNSCLPSRQQEQQPQADATQHFFFPVDWQHMLNATAAISVVCVLKLAYNVATRKGRPAVAAEAPEKFQDSSSSVSKFVDACTSPFVSSTLMPLQQMFETSGCATKDNKSFTFHAMPTSEGDASTPMHTGAGGSRWARTEAGRLAKHEGTDAAKCNLFDQLKAM